MPSSGTSGGWSPGTSAFNAELRERLLTGHPIRGGEYTLPTPMMQRTYALVRELVWARRTGTVFYASPRMGKTRCALAIRDLLREEFPNVYVTLLSSRSSGRPTTAPNYLPSRFEDEPSGGHFCPAGAALSSRSTMSMMRRAFAT